ncbi:hypothetical protein LPJ59_006227 [Coemansia sp. RSA 2399]|nr:hypothetical protein LPJ59_006227 [Coemansia sp. RSA 2399]KAJ1889262.1 hypothetical protein LPJ81_006166 [Coemansia sp. IMI 209127]
MVCSICHDSLLKLKASGGGHDAASSSFQPAALNCGHVFHKTCIGRWFSTSANNHCPLCHKKHSGSALVLFIDADESKKRRNSRDKERPKHSRTSSSKAVDSLASQSLDIDRLCECFDELGIDVPGLDDYAGYDDYCDVLLDELVASTGQLVSKYESDKGKLESRISELKEDLEDSNDLCNAHENEIARLTRLSAAHKTHIEGLQDALQRKKNLINIYERKYGIN